MGRKRKEDANGFIPQRVFFSLNENGHLPPFPYNGTRILSPGKAKFIPTFLGVSSSWLSLSSKVKIPWLLPA
jgi:hypothetical protein